MNNIFFFIKHILKSNTNFLIFFIVFDLYPQTDLVHFRDSICNSVFIDNDKKAILKEIFFEASFYRYKLKRMIHYYRLKKAKNAAITKDLFLTPLKFFLPKQKLYIIQDKMKFAFRLTDLLTMWKKALLHADSLFANPISLKNPYTGNIFKKFNLYNIYFALYYSTYHIPPLITCFFLLDFDIEEFKVVQNTTLQDNAILYYYDNNSDDEKFLDILDMLDNYSTKGHQLTSSSTKKKKEWAIKQLGSLLLSYYYVEYSNNPLVKEKNKKLLKEEIITFFTQYPNGTRIFM